MHAVSPLVHAAPSTASMHPPSPWWTSAASYPASPVDAPDSVPPQAASNDVTTKTNECDARMAGYTSKANATRDDAKNPETHETFRARWPNVTHDATRRG